MTVRPAEQVFEEILPYLEILDAQIGGVIQLLKDKGITTTEEFPNMQRGQTGGAMLGKLVFG